VNAAKQKNYPTQEGFTIRVNCDRCKKARCEREKNFFLCFMLSWNLFL